MCHVGPRGGGRRGSTRLGRRQREARDQLGHSLYWCVLGKGQASRGAGQDGRLNAWDSGWSPAVGYPALGAEDRRISARCGGSGWRVCAVMASHPGERHGRES